MTTFSSPMTGKDEKPIYTNFRLASFGQAALTFQNAVPLKGISSPLEIEQLLQQIVETFCNEFKYPNCQLFLVSQTGSELEFKYGKGRLVEQADRGNQNCTWSPKLGEEVLQEKEGLVGWIGNNLKPVMLPDKEHNAGFLKPFLEIKARSELVVPMLAQNELIGVIAIQSEEVRAFDKVDLQIVNFFARQAAMLIQAANRNYLRTDNLRNLGNLALVSSEINSAGNFPEIGEVVLANAIRALNGDSGSIWLVNDQVQKLQLLATRNLPQELKEDTFDFSPLITNIMRNRAPVFMSGLEKYQEELEAIAHLRASGIEAFCCLPLFVQDEILGALVINYDSPHQFTQTELHTSTILAEQVSAALRNMRNFVRMKQLEQQLARNERLVNLGQQASGIIHDFNNLLSGILGLSEVLLSKSTNQDEKHLIEMLRQSAVDGGQMIRQLQTSNSARLEETCAPVNIRKILQDVIELTRPHWASQTRQQEAPVIIKLEAEPVPPFRANPTELREVFTNLLLNAVDAMPLGGKIDLKVQNCRNEVWISIRDNGTGMTEETRQHLFEPFYTTKPQDGHGLGLSISQSIITRHEGTIQIESTLNEGSCFIVKLPLKPIVTTESAPKTSLPVRPMRVLVVDDDQKLLYVLKRILEIDHHEVTIIGSGHEAVRLFTSQPDSFDLVMTDINMKDLCGWEIAKAVRQLRPELPLIIITGCAESLQAEKIQTYAITEVVSKPYSLEDMQGVIRKVAQPGQANALNIE
ncbi:MAG: hypothetical protein JWP00_3283 [Chloroflexi bacterium]|nr:hypothetical protein [Chloroflexota bacterium]